MEARFRIRTREGRLLEPRTMEIFAELVRSGVVRPEDEVFDALMGVWMPADQHPIVALFQDPLVVHPESGPLPGPPPETAPEEAGEAGHAPTPEASPGPAAADAAVEGIELDLVSTPQKSPEEAQRAFIAKMEEERRHELDLPHASADLPLVTAQSDMVGRSGTFRAGLEPGVADRGRARPAPPKRKTTPVRRRSPVGASALFGILLVAVIVSARVARPALGTGDTPAEAARAPNPRAPRTVTRTEVQIREDAYRGFLGGMEGLRQELVPGDVPQGVAGGRVSRRPGGLSGGASLLGAVHGVRRRRGGTRGGPLPTGLPDGGGGGGRVRPGTFAAYGHRPRGLLLVPTRARGPLRARARAGRVGARAARPHGSN